MKYMTQTKIVKHIINYGYIDDRDIFRGQAHKLIDELFENREEEDLNKLFKFTKTDPEEEIKEEFTGTAMTDKTTYTEEEMNLFRSLSDEGTILYKTELNIGG